MDPDEPGLTTCTSTALLEGLKRGDSRVWDLYVERYRPLILGYARRLRLGPEDAEDLAQVALLEFSAAYRQGKYDRDRGRLRSWLFGIVHRQILSWRRKHASPGRLGQTEASDLWQKLEAEGEMEKAWESEWREAVIRQCLLEVRREVEPQTFEAFERFAVHGRSAEQVAQELHTTANAVFLAKRRVLRRLREILPLMEDLW